MRTPEDEYRRRRTAYHEAGHVAMAYLLGLRAGLVSIRPGTHYSGIAFHGTAAKLPDGMLDRHLGHPIPLLPARLRRFIETEILTLLAGDEAAFLLWDGATRYAPPATVADEAAAEGLARELLRLSRPERETLHKAESDDHTRDEDRAWGVAHAAADDPTEAGAFINWLRILTRNLIWSARCLRLIEALVPELLEHEVLSARAVRELLLAADGKKPKAAPAWAAAAEAK